MRLARRWVLLAVLAAAGLTFLGGTLTWVRAEVPTVLQAVEIGVTGAESAPVVQAAALAVLAAAAALAIGRRIGALLGSVVVIVAGVTVVAGALSTTVRPRDVALAAAAEVSGVREIVGMSQVTVWPYLTAVVGGTLVLLGVVAMASVSSWHVSGHRFEPREAPPTPSPEAGRAARARADWDAMERGDDPSAEEDL